MQTWIKCRSVKQLLNINLVVLISFRFLCSCLFLFAFYSNVTYDQDLNGRNFSLFKYKTPNVVLSVISKESQSLMLIYASRAG